MTTRILAEPASAMAELEAKERMRQHRERFQLALDTYRESNRKEQIIILQTMLCENVADQELADIIANKAGAKVPVEGLPLKRRRLRLRLAVFRYILDLVPAGFPDRPGDTSLFEWLEARWGNVEEVLVPTLRALAALARGANGDRSLGWVFLARILVNKRKPPHDLAYKPAFAMLKAAGISPPERDDDSDGSRFFWWAEAGSNDLLKLQREFRQYAFYLPAAWYLKCILQLESNAILERLRPAPGTECDLVAATLGNLEANR